MQSIQNRPRNNVSFFELSELLLSNFDAPITCATIRRETER